MILVGTGLCACVVFMCEETRVLVGNQPVKLGYHM